MIRPLLLALVTASTLAALDVIPTDPSVVTGASIDESTVSVTVHVSTGATGDELGTIDAPYRSITAAVRRAEDELRAGRGVKVAIAAGLYREGGIIIDGHQLGPDARDAVLVIEGGPDVIISGAEDWSQKSWTAVPAKDGAVAYYHTDWPHEFGLKAPGWGKFDPQGIAAYRREMVIVNGAVLPDVYLERYTKPKKGAMQYTGFDQPATRLRTGTFAVAEREENGRQLYVALPEGLSIDTATIEVATQPFIFTFSGMRNVVMRGLTMRHTASSHKHQGLMIGSPSWMEFGGVSDKFSWNNEQVLIEDCVIEWHNSNGLGVIGCDGLTLRRVDVSHNGVGGIRNWTIRNLLIEDLSTNFNNWRGHRGGLVGWGIAGMKSHGVFDAVVKRHTAIGNRTEGQWWDVDNRNITIENLVAIANRNRGLFLEISPGPFRISDSVIGDSQQAAAFRLDCAQNVTITNTVFFTGDTGNDVINLTAKQTPKTRTTNQSTLTLVTGKNHGKLAVNSGPLLMSNCTIAATNPDAVLVFMNGSAPDVYATMMGGERYAGSGNRYWHSQTPASLSTGFNKGNMVSFADWLAFAAEDSAQWADPTFINLADYDLRSSETDDAYRMSAATLAELRAFEAYIASQPDDEKVELQGGGGDASFAE
ncbi:MAG: right-handed parallel beta-helix repeat-containing protein [Planctomycetota bacterium]|jgi:hypothetical protein|nr:right-handed parallel beta-helix repeat-containing protein [Planctomycetota bacterium]